MRALISRHLLLVCVLVVACAAATVVAWTSDQPGAAAPVSPAPSKPEIVRVSAGDLVTMGLLDPPVDPNVPCLQTLDGYAAFDTVAKGRWSAFGWCSPEPPDIFEACAFPYPPRIICALPSRPAFESVIRNQCVWEDFWAAHVFTPSDPPVIDFDQYLVIAVVLGERAQCGWEVTIDWIHLTENGATVFISECLMLGGPQRQTNPFHFVMLPKSCIPFGHTVCFDHGSEPEPIDPPPHP